MDIIPCFDHHDPKTDDWHIYVLLGRKPTDPEGKYRFIGGFADPADENYKHAAIRECKEETAGTVAVLLDELSYVGSLRVKDPRMESGPDSIITTVFVAFPQAWDQDWDNFPKVEAGDDLCEVKFVHEEKVEDLLVEHHKAIWKLYLEGEE